jgi:hypothetical protein
MSNKIILVFATMITLYGANFVSAAAPQASAPAQNVAQTCAKECPRCSGGLSNEPGGPGEPGKITSNPAACRQETDMCINQCINRINGSKAGNQSGK